MSKNQKSGYITNCQICSSKGLETVLSLGHQPPSDAFLRPQDLTRPEVTFPLNVLFCETCGLVQLDYVVDPSLLFRDYVYSSSTNNSLRVNFEDLVGKLIKRFQITSNDLAVDIGSNDGTLLENYLSHNIRILGIDPSSVADLAIAKGIPTLKEFFNEETAKQTREKYGQAKIITATNVFAHVDQMASFMNGVDLLLGDDGIFVTESHYLLDLITKLQYDSIYHEHLRYYSLKPLMKLFERFGFEVIDVERISTHGGSIRVYAAKKGRYPISKSVEELVKIEVESGLYQKETYHEFANKVKENKLKLLKLLLDLKSEGKRIVGIGAPAKGNTLLNYCHLDPDMIDYLVEKSTLKIGTLAPGTHIPVVEEERLFTEQPDYGLLLSWNLADELIPKLKEVGFKGKFIIPNPLPRII